MKLEDLKKGDIKKTNDTYVPQPPTSREDFDYHIQKNRILTLLKTLTDFIQEDQKPKDEWWYELIDRYEGLFKSLVVGTESLFEEYQKSKCTPVHSNPCAEVVLKNFSPHLHPALSADPDCIHCSGEGYIDFGESKMICNCLNKTKTPK